jgi:group I intron endonuclease
MFYAIYKITNQLDGKIYIGSHKTKRLDDNYMGSGKYLKRAQQKYGIENFKKEILFVFSTAEEMYEKEAEIVNEDFLATENTYNLKIGGFGGWDYINSSGLANHSPEHMLAMAEKRKQLYPEGVMFGKTNRNTRPSLEEISRLYPKSAFYMKNHTEESKRKISDAAKQHQMGSKNSQFGTKWAWVVNEHQELKKIPLVQLEEYRKQGFQRGTKFKNPVSSRRSAKQAAA